MKIELTIKKTFDAKTWYEQARKLIDETVKEETK